jgi:hypothetical protein
MNESLADLPGQGFMRTSIPNTHEAALKAPQRDILIIQDSPIAFSKNPGFLQSSPAILTRLVGTITHEMA